MSSREFKGRRVVIWPSYLDEAASRGKGRRVAKELSVRRPTVEEIVQAAKLLGLNPQVEEKAYSRAWWEERLRVVVDKRGSKGEVLKSIALKVQELRRKQA
ncbi:MAG: signal recognition particle protein Srp19 [Acidilobaceae archaeon]|nr:signal recognition particle protein Srp19 [Acidilobaceae archaeon]MCX8165972.1 signal recognition particle protein Srp19 [Acidilobaceae archaeon]MDW7974615.1 signal recognition particle protein Srp19 [Sulfolobales archaeon]